MSDLILESREDDIVILTFNDPERLNAMTRAMGEAFQDRIAGLKDDSAMRALVITGGGRAFSAGGDLKMINEVTQMAHEGKRQEVTDFMRSFYSLFLSVREIPVPTIAAINGHAIGAGLCVALGCDIRYVAKSAKLALNFTKLGLHPGMGASWTLPRMLGPSRASELMFTSRTISGRDGAAMGMASEALATEDVLPRAMETAREIASCSPIAIRSLKRGLSQTEGNDLSGQLDVEAAEQAICYESQDMLEGISAGRERREPEFKGH